MAATRAHGRRRTPAPHLQGLTPRCARCRHRRAHATRCARCDRGGSAAWSPTNCHPAVSDQLPACSEASSTLLCRNIRPFTVLKRLTFTPSCSCFRLQPPPNPPPDARRVSRPPARRRRGRSGQGIVRAVCTARGCVRSTRVQLHLLRLAQGAPAGAAGRRRHRAVKERVRGARGSAPGCWLSRCRVRPHLCEGACVRAPSGCATRGDRPRVPARVDPECRAVAWRKMPTPSLRAVASEGSSEATAIWRVVEGG